MNKLKTILWGILGWLFDSISGKVVLFILFVAVIVSVVLFLNGIANSLGLENWLAKSVSNLRIIDVIFILIFYRLIS